MTRGQLYYFCVKSIIYYFWIWGGNGPGSEFCEIYRYGQCFVCYEVLWESSEIRFALDNSIFNTCIMILCLTTLRWLYHKDTVP